MSGGARLVDGPACRLAVEELGAPTAPAVLMTHSILSSRAMWSAQAESLVRAGFRVLLVDTRGHGDSDAPPAPYAMEDLVADTVAVLDACGIARAHYVGLSLGGMSGFGLGIAHPERLLSLMLCACRADAPPAVAAPWDERIAVARAEGCGALARPTVERWFGRAFLDAHPDVESRFVRSAAATPAEGFVGCARAIQSLDFLSGSSTIATPTTLLVGANDGVLPQAMADLAARIPRAHLETIANAGHLPNIDQPAAFDAAMRRHFDRVATTPTTSPPPP